MNCDDYRAAFLSGDDAELFGRHVEGCTACRSERARLERLRSDLESPALWLEPSMTVDELLDRVTGRRRTAAPYRRTAARLIWAVAVAVVVSAVTVVTVSTVHRADWAVALTGAEAAPGASGRVSGWNIAGGTRLLLTTEGLDVAPAGSVYELWFMSGGEAFSAGTFSDPHEVRLMVGVPRSEYPDMLVTLQDSSDPSPSDTWLLWSDWNEEGQ